MLQQWTIRRIFLPTYRGGPRIQQRPTVAPQPSYTQHSGESRNHVCLCWALCGKGFQWSHFVPRSLYNAAATCCHQADNICWQPLLTEQKKKVCLVCQFKDIHALYSVILKLPSAIVCVKTHDWFATSFLRFSDAICILVYRYLYACLNGVVHNSFDKLRTIEEKYPPPGHSRMPCDR